MHTNTIPSALTKQRYVIQISPPEYCRGKNVPYTHQHESPHQLSMLPDHSVQLLLRAAQLVQALHQQHGLLTWRRRADMVTSQRWLCIQIWIRICPIFNQ